MRHLLPRRLEVKYLACPYNSILLKFAKKGHSVTQQFANLFGRMHLIYVEIQAIGQKLAKMWNAAF